MPDCKIICGDALEVLRSLPADSVDLVFTSPPYERARLYLEGAERKDLGIARATEDWVAWLVEVIGECVRVCKGLVAFVVEGQTENYRYSCGPLLLAADLCRAGFNLRKPPIFSRDGIPGSGGPDWLRNDYEPIICVTRPGKLPWSDNTAMGHPPKWKPGGEISHRTVDGTRVNDDPWGKGGRGNGIGGYNSKDKRNVGTNKKARERSGVRHNKFHQPNGEQEDQNYEPPVLANPGNIIECLVGGGVMGDARCHKNEAPFPEKLAEFFIRSFCPPGGTVCDPFLGSGTTAAVAVRWGRKFIGCDLRQSQVYIAKDRVTHETPVSLFGEMSGK